MVSTTWRRMWKWHYQIKDLFMKFAPHTPDTVLQQDEDKLDLSQDHEPPHMTPLRWTGLILGPILFLLILLFLKPEGLSPEGVAVLASTVWIAIWWVTEAIPIPATSLLPIILFPLTNAVTTSVVTGAYADNNIYLFMGGFMLALALEKWNLHKRIALTIISVVGTSPNALIGGFMIATAFLSMWVSNTATAMMMLPIATAVIFKMNESLKETKDPRIAENFSKALLLGVGYAASIGGLATLIGTPPNLIFATYAKEIFGVEISFAKWMLFGLPLSLVILIFCWFYLTKIAFRVNVKNIPGGLEVIREEKKALGKAGLEEKIVLTIFVATALLWVLRSFIFGEGKLFELALDDTIIAILAAIVLFIIPARDGKALLGWEDAVKLPWGILLLFGGGLAIAKGFTETGLATWLGTQLEVLKGAPMILVVLAVTTLVIFLTEFTSNTATATMMFPIMGALAAAIDVHPYTLCIAAGIAASCAFMFPVATPPNAVVFSSGYIKMMDMAKAGLWLNIVCIFIITGFLYFLLGSIWGIDIGSYPVDFPKP